MRYWFTIFVFLIQQFAFAQVAPSRYWIRFTDKANSIHSVNNPSIFLSQRAIERRVKQNIAIVENDLPVNEWYVDSIKSTGVKILNRSKWFNSVTIDTSGCNNPLALQKINSFPFVISSTPVGMIKNFSGFTPIKKHESIPLAKKEPGNDEENPEKMEVMAASGFNWDEYGSSYTQIKMLNGDFLHSRNYRGQGMLIAVMDAGFYRVDALAAFDSLRSENRIIATWDFVDLEDTVYENASHGMQVLSVMTGNMPGQLIGTAPLASYLLLRSEADKENPIEELNWATAAEYADSAGADILTTSLGYTTFDDPVYNHSYADMNGNTAPITIAGDMAASKGMLVVNAAGNEGYKPWNYIAAPADGDSILAVGAVNSTAQYAGFSSTGPSFDRRIKPNISAMGQNTVVASIYGGITSNSGTSLATPVISGLAACLWQANRDSSAAQIFHAIERSASQYANPDSLLGYGIPDFERAYFLLKGIDPDTLQTDKIIDFKPNPFTNEFTISFYSFNSQDIILEVNDLGGRVMFTYSGRVIAREYNEIYLEGLSVLPAGIYILRFSYATGNAILKILKQ